MKHSISLLLFFLPALLCAQAVDSTVIRQVDSLIQVSRTLTGEQNFDQALEVNAAAEKIALEKLGRESAAYGSCCFNHGRVLYFQRDYPNAEKWYIESKMIREKALGKEHPDYAWSLNNLASLYYGMRQYEKAERLHIEAKAIREKALGKEHPEYAMSLNNLARLYSSMGQYEKAEPHFIEAKAIREKALGKEHPEYAASLNNLAILYSSMGQYEKAERLHIEAKAIYEKALGKEHPEYAASLNNLSRLYYAMGQYKKAESLVIEAKAIYEKALGKEHPDYSGSLNNLATLYVVGMGQYEKAEPLFIEAKAIREKALGKEHPEYAASLNNLASLYSRMGQYEKAEPLFIEAKAIREKALGKEHPEYAMSLNNLARVYSDMGQYEKAEPLFIEAKAILEKALGKEHPEYAASPINLAILYVGMGQYEKAEPLYIEAKAIYEKALGKEHPEYAMSLNNLAILYYRMGQYEKAEPFYIELSAVNRHLMKKAMLHLSDRELSNYLHKFSNNQNRVFSFTRSADSPKIITTCYDNSLFYKGFLLQAVSRIKQLALSDTAATEKLNRLKGYQRRLAALYTKPIAKRDSVLLAQLETQANDLEKDLVRTVAGFEAATRQVNWQEVQATLKKDEVALEFVHYRYWDKKTTDSTMYAAILIRPSDPHPQFIPLFEEKNLDSLIHTSRERRADYVNHLYSLAKRGATTLGKPKKTLYELLWEPLAKHLAGVNTIYYSPSGLLHRLNLGAIPINPDSVLADRYHLVELGSTRQLVIPNAHKPAANDALLFGGIQYEVDSTAMFQANAGLDSVSIASRGELSFAYTDSTLRTGAWGPLPFTDREVSSVEKTLKSAGFQSETRRGFAATEEAFKTIGAGVKPSPRVLHLATHGFFFPDPAPHGGAGGAPEPVFKLSDHPMIRSGLLLAGGNHAWVTGTPLCEGMEDGILTAYEISQMNLSNTELVVLSACETGLGDIQGNEGVYGLQRAFKIAGAKYLIMSLWQVDDRATMQFMEVFYRKWLQDKLPIPEAFRATQADLRERLLGQPYLWAGFVLVE